MFDLEHLFPAIIDPIIVYVVLVVLARLIGKKLLAQMTFFDFVTGITLGTIGGAFVTNEVKGYYVLFSATVFTILVILTGYLTLKNVTARKIFEGEPLIVVQNGRILEDNMRKIRYNSDDLLMQLREKGIFDLEEIEFTILEPNGKLSVLKKSQNQPVTMKDLKLSSDYKGLPTEMIRDGRIEEQNLKQNNLTHEWLFNELASRNIKNIQDVFLASLSTNGTLYVDLRQDELPYKQKVEDDDSLIG